MRETELQAELNASDSPRDKTRLIELPCLICGSDQADIIASHADIDAQQRFLETFHQDRKEQKQRDGLADRAEFTQDYPTRIVACRSCGFLFRSPRPSSSAVLGAYAKDRYSEAHLQSEFLSQRQWADEKAAFLARWARFQQAPVIVEVGSFVGGFLDAGRRRGWSMLGIDPGKEVTEFCRGQGLPVYCGTLIDAPIDAASVDAVVIWNTFDQLPNPDTTLAAARRVLRNTGFLVIRVPNGLMYRRGMELLQHRGPVRKWMITTLAWNNVLAFPYLHGYTISTLDRLLGRHGFARLMVYRDQLVTLSDPDTKAWARAEEKFIKWSCRCVAAAESLWNNESTTFTPWLDLYYGTAQVVTDAPVAVAKYPPVRLCPDTLADCRIKSSPRKAEGNASPSPLR